MTRLAWHGLAMGVVCACIGCSAHGDQTRDQDLDLMRARSAIQERRFDWARRYFAADRVRHPERVESLRGEALAWLGGYQRSRSNARELLEQLLEVEPQDVEARRVLVSELLVTGDVADAREHAEHLGDEVDDWILRARSWEDADFERARQFLDAALAADPTNSAAWAVGARFAERQGQGAVALERALTALRANPLDYSSAYLVARVADRSGQAELGAWARDLHQVGSALQADGTRPMPGPVEQVELLGRLDALLEARGWERPSAIELRWARASAAAGRLAEARVAVERVITRPDVETGELLDLANTMNEVGLRSAARHLIEAAAAGDPTHHGVVASLALLDLESGHAENAVMRLRDGLARAPWLARFHLLMGRAQRALGERRTAVAELSRAVELAPWSWQWRVELAEAVWAQGDRAGFRRVVSEAPPESEEPGWTAWRERNRGRLRD